MSASERIQHLAVTCEPVRVRKEAHAKMVGDLYE